MTIDRTTVYARVEAANIPGSFVVVFHHADTGLALTTAEALLLEGLPQGMSLRTHPGLPGRAAWTTSLGILAIGPALRRAGFAAARDELANPVVVMPKGNPTGIGLGIVDLTPPGAPFMSGMMPPEGYRTIEPRAGELVFGLHGEEKNGKITVFVKFCRPEDRGHLRDVRSDAIAKCTFFGELHGALAAAKRWDDRFVSALDIAATRRLIERTGATFDPDVFFCHPPETLEFGVSTPDDPDRDGPPGIFVIPIDRNAAHYDRIGEEHLVDVPPYFAQYRSENSWDLTPGALREDVIADMIARGYVHNAVLDRDA